MAEGERPVGPVPEARGLPRSRTRLSLVWFIPIVAALVGVWVAVTRIRRRGAGDHAGVPVGGGAGGG